MEKGRHLGRRIALIAVVALVALAAAAALWVNDTLRADETAWAAMEDGGGVDVREIEGGDVAFVPEESPEAGLIFYPGAKVEPESYAPLMRECAGRGVLCVVVRPTLNLAILDASAADGVREQFPEIDEWMLSGHSMGGVAAGNYASRHEGEFDDVVLLASYTSDDLTGYEGNVLSIVGSNDTVLDLQAYEAASERLPDQAREMVIEGGNHANFGSYGAQSGDSEASIPAEEQWRQAADAIGALAKAA